VSWSELAIVLFVSHAVGDFLLQTEFQAMNKRGGLGGDPVARRALLSHVTTYTAAFVPALIWVGGAEAVGLGAAIFVTHMVQDDYRLLEAYCRRVKGFDPRALPVVTILVDQSLHVVTLFLLALLVA
jgi:hypothetical protein